MLSTGPVLCSLAVELGGAVLLARGLALERPSTWLEGRSQPRWGYNADADLDWARASAEAATGFLVLACGLVMQAIGSIAHSPPTWPFALALPIIAIAVAVAVRAWRRERARQLTRQRIEQLADDESVSDGGGDLVRGYSQALERTWGRNRADGESEWDHLDRELGDDRWVPGDLLQPMRDAFASWLRIEDRGQLGSLWLPWYVDRDDPSQVIHSLDRSRARQLRVQDVAEDQTIRAALAAHEYDDPQYGRQNHIGRIEQISDQWRRAKSLSQGPFAAFRTPDGPVLTEGCHRTCAMYEAGHDRVSLSLRLTDATPEHPDVQAEARRTALDQV